MCPSVPIPVSFFDRQPPPSTTARQARKPLLKSVWQYSVLPPAALALSPSAAHRRPAAGAPAGGAVVLGLVAVVGAAGAVDGVVRVAVGVDGGVVVLAVLVVGAADREVGGATVTVVNRREGRGGTVRAGVLCVVEGRAAVVGPATLAPVDGAAAVDTTGRGAVSSGASDAAGEEAFGAETCSGEPSLSGGPSETDTDADSAVVPGAATSDDCRARLPMISTMPISTPTVTLRAAAVSTTAAFPGTAPPPQRADGSIAPITVAHGYRFRVPRRSRPTDPPGRGRGPVGGGWQRAQSTRDGEFLVRTVPGAHAHKTYRCPGCQQLIAAGTAHLVVWPEWTGDDDGGVAQRRHWHTGCWERRAARGGPALPW